MSQPVYAIDEDELRRRCICLDFLAAGHNPRAVVALVSRAEAIGDRCCLAILWAGTTPAPDDQPYPEHR
jgi:hypothetical protein